jgi:hypothetical protein
MGLLLVVLGLVLWLLVSPLLGLILIMSRATAHLTAAGHDATTRTRTAHPARTAAGSRRHVPLPALPAGVVRVRGGQATAQSGDAVSSVPGDR